jgi:hypothetical protein
LTIAPKQFAWILTYENGSKSPLYQSSDRRIEPTGDPSRSYKPSGRFFKPREIAGAGNRGSAGGVKFASTDREGKTLGLTDAEVEVEFVINTNGTVWGDGKSARYLRMLANRKAAKEGSQPIPPPR